MSIVHETEIENSLPVNFHFDMGFSRDDLIGRLEILPAMCGFKTDKAFLVPLKCAGTTWSNYKSTKPGANLIPVDVTVRIKEHYGVPLDWIYTGDRSGLRTEHREKLAELDVAPKQMPKRGRPKKSKAA